jgi:hypothetical protein
MSKKSFTERPIIAMRGDLEHHMAGEFPVQDDSQVDSQRWMPEALGEAP